MARRTLPQSRPQPIEIMELNRPLLSSSASAAKNIAAPISLRPNQEDPWIPKRFPPHPLESATPPSSISPLPPPSSSYTPHRIPHRVTLSTNGQDARGPVRRRRRPHAREEIRAVYVELGPYEAWMGRIRVRTSRFRRWRTGDEGSGVGG